ncbi:MAG TPA: Asp23/Gls24 family envelope stress response protein [Clostridiales bacterium]|nr:Asp23/Gls24 family envelope stress response protein [Clostridiales bacterium]
MAPTQFEPDASADADAVSSLRISDEVVATIAGIAATEVDGIAGMSAGLVSGISEMLGKKTFARGARVEVGEKETAMDLYVVVEYGVRIPDVAQRVQENVKRAVESMTGLDVVQVNVHVQGVVFHRESKEEEVRVR